MFYTELLNKYRQILDLIHQKKIADALRKIDNLSDICRNKDFKNRTRSNTEIYQNILKYSFELDKDPEREKVYQRMTKSLLELTDELKEELIRQFNMLAHYALAKDSGYNMDSLFEEIRSWIEKIGLEKETTQSSDSFEKHKSLVNKLFNNIWLSDKLAEKQISLLKDISVDKNLPWYFKSVMVSAVTLSALRHFDVQKVNILFDYYQVGEHQIWQRAMVGIMISLYINDERVNIYPEIEQRIKAFHGDNKWDKTIEMVVIQFLRSLETEKISKKIKEEIMPELWKARTHLQDKLNLEDLLSEKAIEDKNPEWETVFEDSPDLYNKIEEFSNLQMEGSDVFLSAFAMLKHFDFFRSPGNWFMPFYKENSVFSDTFGESQKGFNPETFLNGLERTRFLCNSDKYSFCLNIKHLPDAQKSMMAEFFKMELEAMNEMSEEEGVSQNDMQSRTVIIQYIQDLYRFFRIHPMKKEFLDVFDSPLDFHNTGFFKMMVDDTSIIRNIAEFYFEKNHFREALDIYKELNEKENNSEILEKSAYCYQKLENYSDALEHYKKAELHSKPRSWLYNKIAYCYRQLEDFDSAIKYYLDSEKLDPENLFIQTMLGQVHMEKTDYETALKYFYKVEYLAPDNIKVHRPVAWCSFVQGKVDAAEKYFGKIISKEANKNDYINMGHVKWCSGNKSEAIENYKLSISESGNDFSWFAEVMNEDSQYLKKCNITDMDISLMIDYLKLNQGD